MSHILAAVDFSDVTDRVIHQAKAMAQAFSAPLTLLHVAAPNPGFVGYEAGPQAVREARATELRQEHSELLAYIDALKGEGVDAKALLIEGPSAATIVREANRFEARLIVIGSHGHGALYKTLVGSVSEGVIRAASCPILVVPHQAAEK